MIIVTIVEDLKKRPFWGGVLRQLARAHHFHYGLCNINVLNSARAGALAKDTSFYQPHQC